MRRAAGGNGGGRHGGGDCSGVASAAKGRLRSPAIGRLILTGMETDGYSRAFAAGLVCTGAALSIVIPPSIGLVIYGVIAETSISQLFIAAIIPGLVLGVLMLFTLPLARKRKVAPTGAPSLDALIPMPDADLPYGVRLWRSFVSSFWGLMTPVVILGGIYSGIFTPTEAAIVATVYALLVGGFIYRTLTIPRLYDSVVAASASSAVVMLVVAYASLFGWVVTVDDLVGQYSSALLAISDNPWIILLVIMIILLVTGMFMDAVTIMFITLPIFLPVARELGWDPVWFGVLVMINLAIGLFTPPVGINLYVAANITKLPLERIAQGALPFLLTSTIGLVIIALFPQLSSFLVDALR